NSATIGVPFVMVSVHAFNELKPIEHCLKIGLVRSVRVGSKLMTYVINGRGANPETRARSLVRRNCDIDLREIQRIGEAKDACELISGRTRHGEAVQSDDDFHFRAGLTGRSECPLLRPGCQIAVAVGQICGVDRTSQKQRWRSTDGGLTSWSRLGAD